MYVKINNKRKLLKLNILLITHHVFQINFKTKIILINIIIKQKTYLIDRLFKTLIFKISSDFNNFQFSLINKIIKLIINFKIVNQFTLITILLFQTILFSKRLINIIDFINLMLNYY